MKIKHTTVRQLGTRHTLFLGGDRELVMTTGLLTAVCVMIIQTLIAAAYGAVLWIVVLYLARLAAKNDPLLIRVYLRQRHYADYYPARSRPGRHNVRPYKW